jgi:hypothetical protein
MCVVPGTNISGGADLFFHVWKYPLSFCMCQRFKLTSGCSVSWVVVCALLLSLFNCWYSGDPSTFLFLTSSTGILPG